MLCISLLFFSFSLSCCRFEQPKCDGNARAHPNKPKDHYRSRHLQGELNCVLLSRHILQHSKLARGQLMETKLQKQKTTAFFCFLPNNFSNIIKGPEGNKQINVKTFKKQKLLHITYYLIGALTALPAV